MYYHFSPAREYGSRHLQTDESWREYDLLADLAYASLARLRACEAHGIRPTSLRPFTPVSSGWLQIEPSVHEMRSGSKWHETDFPGARDPPSMVETWEHLLSVPMVDHVRRIPMDALEVETSIAEGEQALQALLSLPGSMPGHSRRTKRRRASSSGCCPLGWRR